MIRKIVLFSVLVCMASFVNAQELQFRRNGEFKIVQFTDIHFNGRERSEAALGCIDSVMVHEKPDLVVLTGDIVTDKPAKENLLRVLERVSEFNVPFMYEFGNHDHEQGLTNRELYEIARGVRNCIMTAKSESEELDHVIRIKSHDGKKVSAAIYCMDSHSNAQLKSVGGYGWLTLDQVQWYRNQSKQLTEANGGKPLPALAFFHIPVPEFHEAVKDEKSTLIGSRRETVCSPVINTGMFAAMIEQGDVMGIFVGHDHDNDYTVLWRNILLGYGRFSGGNTVYNNLPCGARVIVLKEDQRRFDTYVRERKGTILHRSTYPDSYVADKWEKRPLEQW